MNIYITLDYELFFGSRSGSVEKCIIEPTRALLDILEPLDIKISFFVDAGYLYALERQLQAVPQLIADYKLISAQIRYLAAQGHGIELHVHPHWEDTFFNEKEGWVMDTSRYKIDDFSEVDTLAIFKKYNEVLTRISGKPTVAYRAGGWSAQPFKKIRNALSQEGIYVDSTVYPKGYYNSQHQFFDFRTVPQYLTSYAFSDDLTIPDKNGPFTEIPISSHQVSPFFFWKFAFLKLQKSQRHVAMGDGAAVQMKKSNILKLLALPSNTVVSMDGYKSTLLNTSFRKYKKKTNDSGNYVIIGHPKAFTPFSLEKISQFIENTKNQNNYVVYN